MKQKYIERKDLDIMLNNGLMVYEHFLGEVKIGRKILSPIRQESEPSFSVYVHSRKNEYWWKDQGIDKFGDHWDFIMAKTGLNFKGAVDYAKQNILNLGDFGIDRNSINEAALKMAAFSNSEKPQQIKSMIIPEFREWNENDSLLFGSTIGMSTCEMEAGGYKPATKVRVITAKKDYTIFEKPDSPIYLIRFPSGNYKVYRPKEPSKRKWISNVEKEKDFYMLEECKGGDVLFIQSGNRDCLAIRKYTSIDSFALNSETADLPWDVWWYIRSVYSKIYVLYDDDKAGTLGAEKIYSKYGIPSLNYVYKKFGVNDFCDLLENSRDQLDEFILFLYSQI